MSKLNLNTEPDPDFNKVPEEKLTDSIFKTINEKASIAYDYLTKGVSVGGKVLWVGVTSAAMIILPYGITVSTEMSLQQMDKSEGIRLGLNKPIDSTFGTGFPPLFDH
ncbi:import receptor subunit tom22 [Anaeramoeba flamelloides]|uniref:Import receptor subunit tom22 n=1 Tax=Anaeramoeba flamelloides TaxID=1746091 RepID=A0ABQ8YQG8_9EUKA|nr:import receptor subunit tom22 [Anaeramoeba flamelloides]